MWMSHVTYANESRHICEWVNTLGVWLYWHAYNISSHYTWLTRDMTYLYMCDMTHSYVWHDSSIYVTWLIHMCGMTHPYIWHDSFLYITWLIRTCNKTHPRHDTFICVTWLIHDMTHSYVCQSLIYTMWAQVVHDSSLTWRFHTSDMTHPWSVEFIHVAVPCSYSASSQRNSRLCICRSLLCLLASLLCKKYFQTIIH